MQKHIRIYAGTEFDKEQNPIKEQVRNDSVNQFVSAVSERYGGITGTKAAGNWVDHNGDQVVEDVATFDVIIDENESTSDLLDYVATLKRQLNQSEILVTESVVTIIKI